MQRNLVSISTLFLFSFHNFWLLSITHAQLQGTVCSNVAALISCSRPTGTYLSDGVYSHIRACQKSLEGTSNLVYHRIFNITKQKTSRSFHCSKVDNHYDQQTSTSCCFIFESFTHPWQHMASQSHSSHFLSFAQSMSAHGTESTHLLSESFTHS